MTDLNRHKLIRLPNAEAWVEKDSVVAVTRPSYAPFAPADPETCTCVDPFADCPTHG